MYSPLSTAQDSLSLQQAVQEALQGNPQIEIAESRVQQATGQRVQAGLRPNPRMTLQTEDIRPSLPGAPFSFVNSTEDYFLLGQVIETAGKRSRRLSVAETGVAVSHLEREQTRRQVISRVSSAYWAAVSTQRLKELASQNLLTYEEDVTYSSNRVHEGVSAEADLIRIQIERDRVRASLLTVTRDADQAGVALSRALNRKTFAPLRLTGSIDDVQPVNIPDLERVLATRPEMAIARESVQQARAELLLQKANGRPDPEVFVGYKRNVGLDTAYAALQIDLPVRNRNQGNVATAAARLHEAEANLQSQELRIRGEFAAASRAYLDGRELLNTLPESVHRAEESERLARAAYREGALDLLKLLDAERSRIQIQSEYLRALTDVQQSIIDLKLVSGQSVAGEQQ